MNRTFTLFTITLFLMIFLFNCIDPRPSQREGTRKLTEAEQRKLQKLFLESPPKPRFPVAATLSIWRRGKLIPALYFYGVDISPVPVRRGKKVTITYYFKPLIKFRYNWGIFLHLEGERPEIYFFNRDHRPAGGLYPSANWKLGKIFKSSYSFTLPADFPGKKLYIYSGLWRPGIRMIVPKNIPNDGRNRILLATVPVEGKESIRPIYVAHYTDSPPRIDGELSDPVWREVSSTGPWPTYYNSPARFKTEAKLTWDKRYLYVAVTCFDDDIWGTYTERDRPLFKEEVVEFFIDANRNFRDYIELQVSPRSVIFDSFFPRYRWPKPWGQLNYDSGMTVKVSIDGTLNDPSDRDVKWTVEFKLPFSRLGPAFNIPPKDGDEWLINFYRLEKSRRSGSEALAWSPVSLSNRGGDFHNIAKFGILRFSRERVPIGDGNRKIGGPHRGKKVLSESSVTKSSSSDSRVRSGVLKEVVSVEKGGSAATRPVSRGVVTSRKSPSAVIFSDSSETRPVSKTSNGKSVEKKGNKKR